MKKGTDFIVGVFSGLALATLAGLLLMFSKGASPMTPTYDILMRSTDVAGLKQNAGVLMSGVQVGRVAALNLGDGGKYVTVTLRIYKSYPVHKDARFLVEQSGFLGDQYIAVVPTQNKADLFVGGDTASAEPPFNLQEVAKSAGSFVQRLDETAKKLDDAIVEVRRTLLNQDTLTNLSLTIGNLRTVSERALKSLDTLNALVETNSPAFSAASSNLVVFTDELNLFANNLNGLLKTNTPGVNATIQNVQASTESLKFLMGDMNAGKGLAGSLVRNEGLSSNVSRIAENLSVTSSNLNHLGLWGILWKKKEPHDRPPVPAEKLVSPRESRQN
ncbi:MAG: MlaD family protein [Verrucomicrobiota bacterium]|jgi:phospholipid/cholesterol/gamma-HCH transport system substrate-binding protein